MRGSPVTRVFYGWWMVAGLGVTELVSWGVLVYTFSVFVVPMHAELGWSATVLNGAYTSGVTVSGLVAVPIGRWLQRHGARGLMTTGSIVGCVGLAGWSQTSTVVGFYGWFLLAGLAMAGTLYEPAFAVTAAWFSRYRARAVLVLTIAGGLASSVFVPLTGILVHHYGWRSALLILATVQLMITVPIHAGVLRRWPSDRGLHPDGAATAPDEHSTAPTSIDPTNSSRTILRRASFRWITVSMFASTAAKLAVTVTVVAYLTHRGYSLSHATLAGGGVGLFQVLGRIISTWLRNHIPEHRTAIALFTLQTLALPLPLLTSGHGTPATLTLVVLVIGFGLGYGLPELLRGTLVAAYYGPHHYARLNGVISMFVVAARALGPLLAGVVATTLNTQAPVLAGAAICTLISAYALHRAHTAHTAETSNTEHASRRCNNLPQK